MTAHQFAETLLTLAVRFRFSVTSWGRTKARNGTVGGHDNSRHLSWEAADAVLDDPQEKPAFLSAAQRLGLKVIDEGDHLHLQTP